MNRVIVAKSRTLRATWNGRPGVMDEDRFEKSRTGLRIVRLRWIDTNTTEFTLVHGGRTPAFREFARAEVPTTIADEARAFAELVLKAQEV